MCNFCVNFKKLLQKYSLMAAILKKTWTKLIGLIRLEIPLSVKQNFIFLGQTFIEINVVQ